MTDQPIEPVNPGDPAGSTTTTGESTAEAALREAYTRQLEELLAQGVPLPPVITTTVTPVSETSQQSTEPMTVETQSKKRKKEVSPPRVTTDTPVSTDSPVSKKLKETETTVPEKVVESTPAKLTAATLAAKTASEIEKLSRDDVSHIKWDDVMAIRPLPSREVRNAIRPLLVKEVQKQQEKLQAQKQTAEDMVRCFNVAKQKIVQTGDWGAHYNGTSKEDRMFRSVLDEKGYKPEAFIKRVVGSTRVEKGQYCTFTPSPREYQICHVIIDLQGFYNDERLKDMNIVAGMTKDSLEVFHVGPGRG
jgi:hypothetical protein